MLSPQGEGNPFDSLVGVAKKRTLAVGITLAASIASIGIAKALMSIPSPPAGVDSWGIVASLFAFGLGWWLLMGLGAVRTLRRLRPLGPLVASSAWPVLRGWVLVLRNGIVATSPTPGPIFLLRFYGSDEKALSPSLANAVRWTGLGFARSLTRLAFVRTGKGPPVMRGELDEIQRTVGAARIYSTAYKREPLSTSGNGPRWVVIVALMSFVPFTVPPPEGVLRGLPRIQAFMERMRESIAGGDSAPSRLPRPRPGL